MKKANTGVNNKSPDNINSGGTTNTEKKKRNRKKTGPSQDAKKRKDYGCEVCVFRGSGTKAKTTCWWNKEFDECPFKNDKVVVLDDMTALKVYKKPECDEECEKCPYGDLNLYANNTCTKKVCYKKIEKGANL